MKIAFCIQSSSQVSLTNLVICVDQEDLVVKLMEFLEAPHATTSELLAEKEQVGYFCQ